MPTQLYSIQGLPTGQLSIMARPRGGGWLLDEIEALRASDVDVLVSLLTSTEVSEFDLAEEAVCCHSQGITYLSFPIPDRGVPAFSAQTFTFVEQLGAYLSEGKHIALHCRQGLGRVALIAASVLVLSGLAPDQAFELLTKAKGYPVPETEEQRAWVVAFSHHCNGSPH
jgi:protein-tyrosine phosphatase